MQLKGSTFRGFWGGLGGCGVFVAFETGVFCSLGYFVVWGLSSGSGVEVVGLGFGIGLCLLDAVQNC